MTREWKLRVEVLPWQEPNLSAAVPSQPETIFPFLVSSPQDRPLSELYEKITTKFGDIHRGKGSLRIKWLEDGWGTVLSGEDRIDQCFEDRKEGQIDVRNFTVRVRRFPPTSEELQNPARFASVAPDSSARPRKRSYNELLEKATRGRHSSNHLKDVNGLTTKRQKFNSLAGLHDPEHPIQSSERDLDPLEENTLSVVKNASQTCIIPDSQSSPNRDRPQMYATPLSSSVSSSRGLSASHHRKKTEIPDSPTFRGHSPQNKTLQLTKIVSEQTPKSESPERENLYSVPSSDLGTPYATGPHDKDGSKAAFIIPTAPAMSSGGVGNLQPTSVQMFENDSSAKTKVSDTHRRFPLGSGSEMRERPNSSFTTQTQSRKALKGRVTGLDIWDIEVSDEEDSEGLASSRRPKRAMLDHVPTVGSPKFPRRFREISNSSLNYVGPAKSSNRTTVMRNMSAPSDLDLEAPYATSSIRNQPKLAALEANTELTVPHSNQPTEMTNGTNPRSFVNWALEVPAVLSEPSEGGDHADSLVGVHQNVVVENVPDDPLTASEQLSRISNERLRNVIQDLGARNTNEDFVMDSSHIAAASESGSSPDVVVHDNDRNWTSERNRSETGRISTLSSKGSPSSVDEVYCVNESNVEAEQEYSSPMLPTLEESTQKGAKKGAKAQKYSGKDGIKLASNGKESSQEEQKHINRDFSAEAKLSQQQNTRAQEASEDRNTRAVPRQGSESILSESRFISVGFKTSRERGKSITPLYPRGSTPRLFTRSGVNNEPASDTLSHSTDLETRALPSAFQSSPTIARSVSWADNPSLLSPNESVNQTAAVKDQKKPDSPRTKRKKFLDDLRTSSKGPEKVQSTLDITVKRDKGKKAAIDPPSPPKPTEPMDSAERRSGNTKRVESADKSFMPASGKAGPSGFRPSSDYSSHVLPSTVKSASRSPARKVASSSGSSDSSKSDIGMDSDTDSGVDSGVDSDADSEDEHEEEKNETKKKTSTHELRPSNLHHQDRSDTNNNGQYRKALSSAQRPQSSISRIEEEEPTALLDQTASMQARDLSEAAKPQSSSESSHSSCAGTEDESARQLHRETHNSMEPYRSSQQKKVPVTSASATVVTPASIVSKATPRASIFTSETRSADARYPTMSGIKGQQSRLPGFLQVGLDRKVSRGRSEVIQRSNSSFSSETSSSDEEEEDDDEDDVVAINTKQPSRAIGASQRGFSRKVSGLKKLAKAYNSLPK